MLQIEETVAIGNVPAEGELTPSHRITEQNLPAMKHRVSPSEPMKPKIVLNISGKYLITKSGILNVFQIVASLACLIAIVMSGILNHDDRETLWWRYRLLMFASVFSLLVSLSSIILHVFGLVELLPIDWSIYDLVMYTLVLVMHFITGSLVLDDEFRFYRSEHVDPHLDWSNKHMTAAVICSYLCVLLYFISSVISCVEVRRGVGSKGGDSPDGAGDAPQRFQLIQQQSNSTVAENA